MSAASADQVQLVGTFQGASGQPKPERPGRKATRFTIRLTETELAYLRSKSGRRPLSAWCRDQLLGDKAEKRIELKQPKLDDRLYASLLSALGESRLSSNVNQLTKHANMGTLDVSQDVEKQLEEAYLAILAMRDALLTALEIKLR